MTLEALPSFKTGKTNVYKEFLGLFVNRVLPRVIHDKLSFFLSYSLTYSLCLEIT